MNYRSQHFNNIYLENVFYKEPKSIIKEREEKIKAILDNAYNLGSLFTGCHSLKYLPNISNWDIKNSKNMSCMFLGCTSLISLPDISKWNTKNIINI